MTRATRQSGLTLVELLISMTLGLILLLGLSTLFVQTNSSYRQNEALMGLQDQARFALSTLSRDLEMAGYWGGIYQSSQIEISSAVIGAISAANDCGPDSTAWALTTANRVEFFDWNKATAGSSPSAASAFKCLSNLQPGADAFAIRRVAGQAAAELSACGNASLAQYGFYLKSNGAAASLFRMGASYDACSGETPTTVPMSFYKFVPRIYYVRSYAQTAGDGIPTLCRRELQHVATPTLTSTAAEECLAEGVEDLQIVWGIAAVSDDPNPPPERYTSAPTAGELSRAVSAQIFLLMRAARADTAHVDETIYSYGDKIDDNEADTGGSYKPNDVADPPNTPAARQARHFYRRLFSITVKIRNPLPQS